MRRPARWRSTRPSTIPQASPVSDSTTGSGRTDGRDQRTLTASFSRAEACRCDALPLPGFAKRAVTWGSQGQVPRDKRMAMKIVGILVVLAVILLVMAATRPSTVQVQRSALIGAPPERVFALINDFHEWPRWAPQDREDPAMRRTYSGADRGAGAVSDWQGKGSTGRGQMTISESV